MAKDANTNEPSTDDVAAAVNNIEKQLDDLLKEKMAYMSRAKRIRDIPGESVSNRPWHCDCDQWPESLR